MKKYLRALQPVLIIGVGIGLALAAAFMPSLINPPSTASALHQITTPTSALHPVSQPGSTDGIAWMGFIIVLIVILPILLRRQFWAK